MKDMILARIISKMDFRENACEWSLSGFINEVSQIYTRHKTWSIWDIAQQKSNLMVWNRSRRKLFHLRSEKSFNITNSRVRINKKHHFWRTLLFIYPDISDALQMIWGTRKCSQTAVHLILISFLMYNLQWDIFLRFLISVIWPLYLTQFI